MPAGPLALTSSAGIPHRHGNFSVIIILFTACSTSDRSGGRAYLGEFVLRGATRCSSSFGLLNSLAPCSFNLFKISSYCSKTIPSSSFMHAYCDSQVFFFFFFFFSFFFFLILFFGDFIASYIFFELPIVLKSIFWHWFSSQIALSPYPSLAFFKIFNI